MLTHVYRTNVNVKLFGMQSKRTMNSWTRPDVEKVSIVIYLVCGVPLTRPIYPFQNFTKMNFIPRGNSLISSSKLKFNICKSFLFSGGGGNFVLSTSSLGYTIVNGFVGPMCRDGYACFYSITNQSYALIIFN